MTPRAVQSAVQRFRAALVLRFGDRLQEIVLFGSHARGEAREDSDVDLLVVIRGLTESERREVIDLAYDADAADQEGGWVGLSALPYSDTQAADMRSRERLLFADIAAEGIAL